MGSEAAIMIGTPAYNHQIHTDYLHSVMGFYRAGINYSLMTIGNESLITRARNSIITKFNEHKDFSHLLFLDGDVFLDAKDLLRLIEFDKDVIGAPVPLKGFDAKGNRRYNTGKILKQDSKPVIFDRVGTAVFMLSRKAVDALIDDAQQRNEVYQSNAGMPDGTEKTEHFDIFQVGVVNGEYLSEDYWVCHKLREMGFDIHVDLTTQVRHNGMYQF